MNQLAVAVADSSCVRERIVIISDTHLGRPRQAARSAEALRPLWHRADHVVVNGDAAEINHPRHRDRAAIEARRLCELCKADGVKLTLLAGNHDPFISPLRHLLLADGLVFVTHGHALHPAVAPWSPRASVMRAAHTTALAHRHEAQVDPLEASLEAATRASAAEWRHLERYGSRVSISRMLLRPLALLHVMHYWRIMPRLAAAFLRRHAPEARFIVLGHTHRPGIWSIDDRIIINTGGFGFPGRPWAAVFDDRGLSVVPIHRHRGRYHLVNQPLRQFTLPARDAVRARPIMADLGPLSVQR